MFLKVKDFRHHFKVCCSNYKKISFWGKY